MKSVKRTSLTYLGCLSMSLVTVMSCSNQNPDSKEVAEEQNEERIDNRKMEKDADFLVEAAAIHLEEIKLGELAQQKGSITDVKELGKMMVTDHRAAMEELKSLAVSEAVKIPEMLTEDGQDAYDDLNEETGKDFDKEYCDMMVNGHKKAIRKFEDAALNAEDADVRNWASSMLPTLRTHLDHAIACQEKCKARK